MAKLFRSLKIAAGLSMGGANASDLNYHTHITFPIIQPFARIRSLLHPFFLRLQVLFAFIFALPRSDRELQRVASPKSCAASQVLVLTDCTYFSAYWLEYPLYCHYMTASHLGTHPTYLGTHPRSGVGGAPA